MFEVYVQGSDILSFTANIDDPAQELQKQKKENPYKRFLLQLLHTYMFLRSERFSLFLIIFSVYQPASSL